MSLFAAAVLSYFMFTTDFPFAAQVRPVLTRAFTGAFLAVEWMVIQVRLDRPRLARKPLSMGQDAKKLLGRQRRSIDATCIRVKTVYCDAAYFWNCIDTIAASEDHAIFYSTSTDAFIVPGRAYPDRRAFTEFVDTARYYCGAARAATI